MSKFKQKVPINGDKGSKLTTFSKMSKHALMWIRSWEDYPNPKDHLEGTKERTKGVRFCVFLYLFFWGGRGGGPVNSAGKID